MKETFTIDKFSIEYSNIEQVISMGGPIVGNCSVDGKHLLDKCVVQHPTISYDKQFLGFVKFVPKRKFWETNHFKLVLFNVLTGAVTELKKKFPALLIEEIGSKKIVIYESFHKEIEKYKRTITITA